MPTEHCETYLDVVFGGESSGVTIMGSFWEGISSNTWSPKCDPRFGLRSSQLLLSAGNIHETTHRILLPACPLLALLVISLSSKRYAGQRPACAPQTPDVEHECGHPQSCIEPVQRLPANHVLLPSFPGLVLHLQRLFCKFILELQVLCGGLGFGRDVHHQKLLHSRMPPAFSCIIYI